jgi:pimeloyl-ACP methyl ester carboxylesterase
MGAMPQLTTDDGLTLAWFEWGEDHRGDGPPVVLHHGFVVNTHVNWDMPGITTALAAAGRHVVGIDARGHGWSDAPHDPARYGEGRMATDLRQLFDLLGADEVHLVGYSMGAIVSLLTAAADPRVTRLVVGGVGAGVVELGGVDRRAVVPERLIAVLAADDAATLDGGDDDEMARGFRGLADMLGADRQALAAQARSVHGTPIPLDAIAAPTLVLAGVDDPLAARPEVLAAAIPDASVQLVPGDHMTAVTDPSFTAALVDFLG